MRELLFYVIPNGVNSLLEFPWRSRVRVPTSTVATTEISLWRNETMDPIAELGRQSNMAWWEFYYHGIAG